MSDSFISTPRSTINPSWTERNKTIARYIQPTTQVLDLGCGSKDLLRYIEPSNYLGVDYDNALADVKLNLNGEFAVPAGNWDYIVCSGVLEYLNDVEDCLARLHNHSKFYIFTWWKKHKSINKAYDLTVEQLEDIIKSQYTIVDQTTWGAHMIYYCADKSHARI